MNRSTNVALAVLPKISSALSICGSSLILAECFYFDRKRLDRAYNRLLCAMALFDILESIWNFASTWAIPKEASINVGDDGHDSGGVAFAVGNEGTCIAQGFFLQLGLVIPVLNACLSLYYVLVIRYSWSEEKISTKAEPWFYIVSIALGLGTSVAGVPLNLYHSSGMWCWIAEASEHVDVKSNHYQVFRYAFYFVPLFISFAIISISMGMISWTVMRFDMASKAYSSSAYAKRCSAILNPGHKLSKMAHIARRFSHVTLSKSGCEVAALAAAALPDEESNIVEGIRAANVKTKRSTRKLRDKSSNDDIGRILALKRSMKNNDSDLIIEKDGALQTTDPETNKTSSRSGCQRSSHNWQDFLEKEELNIPSRKNGDKLRLTFLGSFQSRPSSAHLIASKKEKKKSKSRQVTEQALYYVLSFVLTFVWSFLNRFFRLYGRDTPQFILLGNAFFDPMQGFINYLVYIRPRLIRFRKKHPNCSVFQCFKAIVMHRDIDYEEDDSKNVEDCAKKELSEWRNVTNELRNSNRKSLTK